MSASSRPDAPRSLLRRMVRYGVLFAAFPGAGHACPDLSVQDPWIRAAPPSSPVLAGYARLRNDGSAPLRIDGFSGPIFERVELHETQTEDGRARMRRHPGLTLAPGQEATLQPGGLHLMLFGPDRRLESGAEVTIEFRCGDASGTVPFTVRK